ncbi:MAG: IS4 family transposase, partial [Verrucomicrobiales bacterium]
QEVIRQLIASQKLPKFKQKVTQRFKRILVEDSTFVPMGAINAANFPACGNQTGVTAGFKLDLAFDARTNTVVHQSFGSARESDKKLGEHLLSDVAKGDLVLRDMGYFGCAALNLIAEKEAFWISRLPSSINVFTSNGEPLEKKLRSRKNHFIDEVVTLGNDGATKVRLVGIRADDALAAQRRRSRKTVAQKFGNSPKYQSLVRDGWHLILTNLDQDVTAKELFEIYSIRWSVEIRFKAWKQSLNMKPTLKRYTNYHHLCCIALAALIQQLVVNHIFMMAIVRVKRALSYEKVSEVISQQLGTLTLSSLGAPLTLEERHVWMDKRSRKSLYERLLAIK